jgi:hypothetical protein
MITLDGDLLEMVKRWTKDGVMTFRWPCDNEEMLDFAASYWIQPEWDLNDIALEAVAWGMPDGIRVSLKSVTTKNEGPGIEAFAKYMHDVPARNAVEVRTSFQNISTALFILCQALKAYKSAALEKLAALHDALGDNERWAWWPLADDEAIDKRARDLIDGFNRDMATSEQFSNLLAAKNRAVKVLADEKPWLEQVAKPLPDDIESRRSAILGPN